MGKFPTIKEITAMFNEGDLRSIALLCIALTLFAFGLFVPHKNIFIGIASTFLIFCIFSRAWRIGIEQEKEIREICQLFYRWIRVVSNNCVSDEIQLTFEDFRNLKPEATIETTQKAIEQLKSEGRIKDGKYSPFSFSRFDNSDILGWFKDND